eukprot:scaffold91118_cov13-Prasinocladus_malaysianus.AAC.1
MDVTWGESKPLGRTEGPRLETGLIPKLSTWRSSLDGRLASASIWFFDFVTMRPLQRYHS